MMLRTLPNGTKVMLDSSTIHFEHGPLKMAFGIRDCKIIKEGDLLILTDKAEICGVEIDDQLSLQLQRYYFVPLKSTQTDTEIGDNAMKSAYVIMDSRAHYDPEEALVLESLPPITERQARKYFRAEYEGQAACLFRHNREEGTLDRIWVDESMMEDD